MNTRHTHTRHTELVTHRHRLSDDAEDGPERSVANVRLGLGKTVRQQDSNDLTCDAMKGPGPPDIEVAAVGLGGVKRHLQGVKS